jgi:hypothetical protein
MTDRHSFKERAPKDRSHEPVHGIGDHGHAGAHLVRDYDEDLANKIFETGADYIAAKTEARYSDDEVPRGDAAVATGPDPHALANKIVKEGARELERAEGHVVAGGVAAAAQKAAMVRNDPSVPEHVVVQKITERLAAAEGGAGTHMFVGPNPEKGRDKPNTKMRHRGAAGAEPYVTGGFKTERNPDVSEPRT